MKPFWRGFWSVFGYRPEKEQRKILEDGTIALWQAYCDKKAEAEALNELIENKQAVIRALHDEISILRADKDHWVGRYKIVSEELFRLQGWPEDRSPLDDS